MSPLICLLTMLTSPGRAGGWTQPQGAHYLKVWERTLVGTRGFRTDGEVFDLGEEARYTDLTLNLYAEVGVTDAWTVVLSTTPVGRGFVEDDTDLSADGGGGTSQWYSGTTLVGARRRLLDGDVKLAAEGRVGGVPPLGDARIGEDFGEGWFWQTAVPTLQAEGELQVGRGLRRGWVTAAVGGRWQSAAALPAATVLGSVSAGWTFGRASPSLMLSTVQPLEPVSAPNISGSGATRYIGLEPGVSVRLGERWSAVASMGSVLMAEANAATPSLNVGLEHR